MTTRAQAISSTDSSELEKYLRELWQQMLQVTDIAPTQSFPALGGDSLAASRMLGEVLRVCGVNITLGEFYRADTISALAALIGARLASPDDADPDATVPVASGEI